MTVKSSKSPAPALERGLDLIEFALKAQKQGASFSEFKTNLTIPEATLVRLIQVLIQRDYLEKDSLSGRYFPGHVLKQLHSKTALLQLREQLRQNALPLLHELHHKTQQSTALFFWDETKTECLLSKNAEGGLAMQIEGEIKTELIERPWAWLFWSQLPQTEQTKELAQHSPNDPKITTRLEGLADFARNGYVCHEKPFSRRIAAPVANHQNHFIASLALGGTPQGIETMDIPQLGKLLCQYAEKLSQSLKQ